jgi:hypothetical protein
MDFGGWHLREHHLTNLTSARFISDGQLRQLIDDSAILDFLLAHVGWFDMYVEGEYAAYVRYCFENMLDAEIFRARFEPKQVVQARGMSV